MIIVWISFAEMKHYDISGTTLSVALFTEVANSKYSSLHFSISLNLHVSAILYLQIILTQIIKGTFGADASWNTRAWNSPSQCIFGRHALTSLPICWKDVNALLLCNKHRSIIPYLIRVSMKQCLDSRYFPGFSSCS